jgi:putative flippase GtrA
MTLPPWIDDLLQRVLPAWIDRKLVAKAISFGMIGCVNATVDFVVFSIAHLYVGLPIVPANLISWCLAVTNSYVLNSMITFAAESGGRLSLGRYVGFAATQAGGLVANTITVFVLSFFIPVLIAKLLAIGASFVVDFSLSHLLVFRRREGTSPLGNRETELDVRRES